MKSKNFLKNRFGSVKIPLLDPKRHQKSDPKSESYGTEASTIRIQIRNDMEVGAGIVMTWQEGSGSEKIVSDPQEDWFLVLDGNGSPIKLLMLS